MSCENPRNQSPLQKQNYIQFSFPPTQINYLHLHHYSTFIFDEEVATK